MQIIVRSSPRFFVVVVVVVVIVLKYYYQSSIFYFFIILFLSEKKNSAYTDWIRAKHVYSCSFMCINIYHLYKLRFLSV